MNSYENGSEITKVNGDTKQFLKKNKLRIWEGKYKENTFNCVCIPHPNPRLDSDYGSFDSSKFQLNINKILSYS